MNIYIYGSWYWVYRWVTVLETVKVSDSNVQGYALRFAGKTQRTRAMLLAGVLFGWPSGAGTPCRLNMGVTRRASWIAGTSKASVMLLECFFASGVNRRVGLALAKTLAASKQHMLWVEKKTHEVSSGNQM